MTDIITDITLPADQKMKLYNQNLNKFLLKYDPESFELTPALRTIAKVVTEYLEKNNNPLPIENDLKAFLFKSENNSNLNTPIKSENNSVNNFKINSPTKNEKLYDFNQKYYTLDTNDLHNNSEINNTLFDNTFRQDLFEPNTNPASNTRSKNQATHEEGLDSNKNLKASNFYLNEENITR